MIENTLDDEAKDYVISAATDNVSAENEAFRIFTDQTLISKVNKLPEKHRLPIILFYFPFETPIWVAPTCAAPPSRVLT